MNCSESTLLDKNIKGLGLDPNTTGVMRGSGGNYPEVIGDPYPYGIDPVSCLFRQLNFVCCRVMIRTDVDSACIEEAVQSEFDDV